MKTRFHQLVDIIAAELARPSDPAALLDAYAELLQFGENPPVIIAARNELRQRQLKAERLAEETGRAAAEAEAQRIREEAERVRRDLVETQTTLARQLRLDFNKALAMKDLEQALLLAGSFRQAHLQKGLLEAVGGFEERQIFFANVAEKIEKLEQVHAAEAKVREEQDALKTRAKLALVGPTVTNGHSRTLRTTVCRMGKTARDRAKNRIPKPAAIAAVSKNGQKKGGKKSNKK